MPTVAPPIVEDEDEPSATGWIVAIVVLALLAAAIGAGAMIYRSRVAPPDTDGEGSPSGIEPDDDSPDDDDDEPSAEDYEASPLRPAEGRLIHQKGRRQSAQITERDGRGAGI